MYQNLTLQIVAWNSTEELEALLPSLKTLASKGVFIRYIDNNSTDDSVSFVRKELPQADIIELQENTGFVGGHNAGFAKCETEFVAVVNPDVTIDVDGFLSLLEVFKNTAVAAAQGKIYREGVVFDSAGIIRTLSFNGIDRGAGIEDGGQYNTIAEIGGVTGALCVYRLSALRDIAHGTYKIGDVNALEVYDRSFFGYREDVDLGWRLQHADWKNLYVPVSTGSHIRSLRRSSPIGWSLEPRAFVARLRSLRTRYSLRNYAWTVVKNAPTGELLIRGPLVDLRLLVFFCLSLLYWPLLSVWPEIFRGMPEMLEKRAKILYNR